MPTETSPRPPRSSSTFEIEARSDGQVSVQESVRRFTALEYVVLTRLDGPAPWLQARFYDDDVMLAFKRV